MRIPDRIRRQLLPWGASLLMALMALLVACGGSSNTTANPTATVVATATLAATASATASATVQATATNTTRPNPTRTPRPRPTATPRPKPTPTATPKPPTPTPTPKPKTWVIDITGFAFTPTPLTIRAGDTVEWINNDPTMHTTTSDSGDPASWDKTLMQNQTFSFTFTTAGTYTYHCNIHPFMTGMIIVTP